MAQKLLHGSDVVSALEQMSGKGMAEGVAGHSLADPRCLRRIGHSSLNDRFVQVIPSLSPSWSFHRLVAGNTQCHCQPRAAEGIFRAMAAGSHDRAASAALSFVEAPRSPGKATCLHECLFNLVSLGELRAPVGRLRVAATKRCAGIVEEWRRSRRSAAAVRHPVKQD